MVVPQVVVPQVQAVLQAAVVPQVDILLQTDIE